MNISSSRVIVVTGGSKGIGRAVAFRFADEEARIVLVHYDPDEIESNTTLETLSERGVEAESHRVDVSSFEAVDSLCADILSRLGKIDVLVNNAGITKDTLLMRMSEENREAGVSSTFLQWWDR
jgi:3-oxoacyl-[acyl-carrier protein] reductase